MPAPTPSELLDAEIGGADSNSYLTLATAATMVALLIDSAVRTAWDAYSDDDQARGLMLATKQIDSNRFNGFKVSSAQALEFPRNEQDQPITELPPEVLDACLDQAINLLANSTTGGFTERQALRMAGVSEYTIGSFSEKLTGAGSASEAQLSSLAQLKLGGWIARTGRIVNSRDVPRTRRGWYPFL